MAGFPTSRLYVRPRISYPRTVLATLTRNGSFLREFVSAPAPCFVLGLVEEGKSRCGCVNLRFAKAIPRMVLDYGFRFGHEIFGNNCGQVVHLSFEFYGWEAHHALLNPNHPVTRVVLLAMGDSGDYFFFALDFRETHDRLSLGVGGRKSAGTPGLPASSAAGQRRRGTRSASACEDVVID